MAPASTPQPAAEAAARLHRESVTSYVAALHQRDAATIQSLQVCKESVLEAAQLYIDEGQAQLLPALQQQLLAAAAAQRAAKAHAAALEALITSYRPSMSATDFTAELARLTPHAADGAGSCDSDEELQELQELMASGTAADTGGAAAGDGELGSDDELLVVGGEERNERCPYTMRPLLELQEPLQDQQGFVYEATAIRDALRRSGGRTVCPLPGVQHMITERDLKPCRRVIRAQRNATRRAAAGKAGGSRIAARS